MRYAFALLLPALLGGCVESVDVIYFTKIFIIEFYLTYSFSIPLLKYFYYFSKSYSFSIYLIYLINLTSIHFIKFKISEIVIESNNYF